MTRPLGFWGSGGRKEKYGPGGLAVGSSDDIHVSWGPCVVCLAVVYSLSCVFATPWTAAHQAPLSMGFSRQEYWSGLPFPPPGIFPTQGWTPSLLHCRQILYRLSHEGSPKEKWAEKKDLQIKLMAISSGLDFSCTQHLPSQLLLKFADNILYTYVIIYVFIQ